MLKHTYDTCVVLKVKEDTVLSSPCFALTNDDRRVDCVDSGDSFSVLLLHIFPVSPLTLLPQVGLSLLYCREDHISSSGSRQSVETGSGSCDGDNVEVFTTAVVAAIHDWKDVVSGPSYA